MNEEQIDHPNSGQALTEHQLEIRISPDLHAKRRYAVKQNLQRGCAIIDALFARHSRLNVIRVDFTYLEHHLPSLEQAKDDFNRLLNNSRHNAVFDHVVGVIWRLEWAPLTGWHWHVIFFVDDSKRNHDWFIAQQIGDYWCNAITPGRGRMHNCHTRKHEYPELGIGTIQWDDFAKRDVLVRIVLKYLTEIDETQFVPLGTRTFGTSQMPRPHSGLGRPRSAYLGQQKGQRKPTA